MYGYKSATSKLVRAFLTCRLKKFFLADLSLKINIKPILHYFWPVFIENVSCYSYVKFSSIAARVLRQALKPEFRADALKREETHIKFTAWKDGKPASTYSIQMHFIHLVIL
jgi:F-type H+-transporting ATPase subunit epsilon